ncbi:unnamed protein product [Symbiodinium sp. CCMP2456]|nr:unnamed protein product [Symbiodinium sp. CCMP2456]
MMACCMFFWPMSLLTWSSAQDARAQNWPSTKQEVRFVAMTAQAEVPIASRDRLFEIVRDGEYAEDKKVISTADMSWRHTDLQQNCFFYRDTTPSRLRTLGKAMRSKGREFRGGGCLWTDTSFLGRIAWQHGSCEISAWLWI